jgi:hypothetical protein
LADFYVVQSCFSELLRDIRSFEQGRELIKSIIAKNFTGVDVTNIDKLDLSGLYNQFEVWLIELLENEPMPSDIVAVNFGVFESGGYKFVDGIQLYVSGSTIWDEEDTDWVCNTDYFPEGRYSEIDMVSSLLNLFDSNEEIAFFLYLSVPVLFIYRFTSMHAKVLLGERDEIHIATGFDDGDVYNIGILRLGGIEKA